MSRTLIAAAAAGAALLPIEAAAQTGAQAEAQSSAEATLYSKGRFKGPSKTIIGPTQFAQPFVMRSVMIAAGAQWEFCSGVTYSGCRQVSQPVETTIMTVRSARPVAAILSAPSGPGAAPALPGGAGPLRGGGGSLRGLASEYFVAPDRGGLRIEVVPGTAEAMSRLAIEFCRSRGWRTSAHERLQSVAGRFYLADVLCADAGR